MRSGSPASASAPTLTPECQVAFLATFLVAAFFLVALFGSTSAFLAAAFFFAGAFLAAAVLVDGVFFFAGAAFFAAVRVVDADFAGRADDDRAADGAPREDDAFFTGAAFEALGMQTTPSSRPATDRSGHGERGGYHGAQGPPRDL